MAKEFSKSFYRSAAWLSARAALIRDRHGICQKCGEIGRIVHHRVELTPQNISDPFISLDPSNLMLVCHRCHDEIHLGVSCIDEGLRFDEHGELIPIGPPVGNRRA